MQAQRLQKKVLHTAKGPSSPAVPLRSRQAHFDDRDALRSLGRSGHYVLSGQGRAVKDTELFALARDAKIEAKVPISGFRVGAAAVTKSGKILTGANLEVSDRPCIGTCAETSIAFQLKGEALDTIVIASDSENCIAPCGACRQTLAEVAPLDARVVMTSTSGEMKVTTVGELLPMPDELAHAEALAPYAKALERAVQLSAQADNGGRNIPALGAVIVDDDGTLHGGATRKASGTFSLAVQMAADARFLNASGAAPKLVIIAGEGPGPLGLPVPSGRERQELGNLGAGIKVLLVNPKNGSAAFTEARSLLPFAYHR